jgi:hypothetical protein
MLAKHPKTGKDIRVINTDASRWKDRKTLSFSNIPTPWDSIWTSTLSDNSYPTFYITLGSKSLEELKEITKYSRLIFVSESKINAKTLERLGASILPLEDLHRSFPQLGKSWNGSLDDAVAMISNLFHYKCLFTNLNVSSRLSIPITKEAPEPLWLITQFYKSSNETRATEIQSCLERNIENPLISKILLLNESHCLPSKLKNNPKVSEQIIGHRITYADVMKAISSLPDNALVAFSNADICIDPISWRNLWNVTLKDICISLLRYDVPDSGNVEDATLFGPRADSQDTWVVRACDVKQRGEKLYSQTFQIPFGQMGCDNAFALEILRQKFCVINPCFSLITWHFHSSAFRTYDKNDLVDCSTFHYIHPSGLHDLNPCSNLKPYIKISSDSITVQRPIRGNGATSWIYNMCKQGEGSSFWNLQSSNPLTISKQGLLYLKDVYQTSKGLLYDSQRMYVGSGKEAQTVWAESPVQALLPTLLSQQGFAVPWPKDAEKVREIYIVRYLSKVLRLREVSGWKNGDFFCPEHTHIQNAIKLFRWGVSPLPLIKYETDIQVFHKEAYGFSPEDMTVISPDDISALRRGLGPFWKETIERHDSYRTIVIVEDGNVITSELAYKYEEVLERCATIRIVYPGKSSPERMLALLSGAWGIICPSGLEASGWNWALPKGAFVFEVQSSDDISLNISAASGLEHRFSSTKDVLDLICEEEALWEKIDDTCERPIVWIPRKEIEGFFSHSGDELRELIHMWAGKKYITLKTHPTSTMVWWKEVGKEGILLYDRLTHEIRLSAPLPEREYKFALFGGPKPVHDSSPWIYWPRNPDIVESCYDAGLSEKDWNARSGIAEYNDTLDVKTYLILLSNSHFSRHIYTANTKSTSIIESLSMGCVPIIDNTFDMKNFIEPLELGVHYVSAEVTQDIWENISNAGKAWWKRNCSCEGSFLLTKRLIDSL